jgi:hypothetical protein
MYDVASGIYMHVQRKVPWPRFLQLLGIVAFVATPWGHGLDTHRFWEALTAGIAGMNDLRILRVAMRPIVVKIVK